MAPTEEPLVAPLSTEKCFFFFFPSEISFVVIQSSVSKKQQLLVEHWRTKLRFYWGLKYGWVLCTDQLSYPWFVHVSGDLSGRAPNAELMLSGKALSGWLELLEGGLCSRAPRACTPSVWQVVCRAKGSALICRGGRSKLFLLCLQHAKEQPLLRLSEMPPQSHCKAELCPGQTALEIPVSFTSILNSYPVACCNCTLCLQAQTYWLSLASITYG